MDVDLLLILTWAVIITGAIWFLDFVALRPRRLRAAQALGAAGAGANDEAVERTLKEPLLTEYARSFFPVLLLVLVLRSFLVEPYQIPSESMVPTLAVGDFILVNKYAYGVRLPVLGTKIFDVGEPQRGDVMVFIPPHEPRYFIKRVIGLPGDHIEYRNKQLYINGVIVPADFVSQEMVGGRVYLRAFSETLGSTSHLIYRYPARIEPPQQWDVPPGHYFMMGDNRGKSDDSRRWGFVPDHNVVGKAVAVWIHKEPGLNWPTFEGNRWIN
ncbi:MAG: signal peptidase I [Gammaproteobacteria bacterium]|nr:signal peptidase I [Gammaproteobacteria bacterium]